MDIDNKTLTEKLKKRNKEIASATSFEKEKVIKKWDRIANPTLWDLSLQTSVGLAFAAFCGLFFASIYIFGFGYGLGHFFYYVFVETLYMPFTFHTMYQCAMIPFVNILILAIAVWILIFKFAGMAIWCLIKIIIAWLPSWIQNIAAHIGK